jgi:hypothetical protein
VQLRSAHLERWKRERIHKKGDSSGDAAAESRSQLSRAGKAERERERKGSRWVGFKPYLDVDEGCGSGEEEEAEVAGAPSHGRPEISLVS